MPRLRLPLVHANGCVHTDQGQGLGKDAPRGIADGKTGAGQLGVVAQDMTVGVEGVEGGREVGGIVRKPEGREILGTARHMSPKWAIWRAKASSEGSVSSPRSGSSPTRRSANASMSTHASRASSHPAPLRRMEQIRAWAYCT